jgi:hypothetical protein
MNNLSLNRFFHLLFILFIYELKCQNNEEIKLYKRFNFTYYVNTTKILLGKMKVHNGIIFCNLPRVKNNKTEEKEPTFLQLNEKGEKIQWPNEAMNNISGCSHFLSVVDFDFGDENNIYILDEGDVGLKCPIKLYEYNITNNEQLQSITILERNSSNQNISLNNFVIDTINDYIYISYFNNISNNGSIKRELGFISKKLKDNDSLASIIDLYDLNDIKYLYDAKYSFRKSKNIVVEINKLKANIALSCDGKYLFFSPLASRMIFSILTEDIRKGNITKNMINEAYKHDLASAMITGNLRSLYFVGVENKKLYIEGQIDNDLSIFDYKGFDVRENKSMNWVTAMSIDNGYLYINSIKSVKNKTTGRGRSQTTSYIAYIDIFNTTIKNEKSYIYKCSGLEFVWSLNAYIIWLLFVIILFIISIFVHYGNQQDKEIKLIKNK